MDQPEGEGTEDEGGEYEFRSVQDEDTSDEEEEGDAADKKFRSLCSEEYGESEDAVSTVALDVFEVFYRKDEGIGDEEEEEKWLRKCLELIRSDEEKSREKYEYARAGGRECRDPGKSLESEWRGGIHPGDCLIAEEKHEYFERNNSREDEGCDEERDADRGIIFWINSIRWEWTMGIR